MPPAAGGWAPTAPAPGGVPLRPLSVGDVLSGAFTLIRRNPVATLGLSAIVATLSGILTTVISWIEQNLLHQLRLNINDQTPSTQVGHAALHFFASFVPFLLLTVVITFVVQSILTGMLTGALGHGLIGNKITIEEAWRIARVGSVIALSLLIGVIVAVPWVVVFLIVVGLAVAKITALAVLVGIVGFIGLFIGTIFVAIRLIVAVPVVVLEKVGPVTALRRSWQLVAGNWWRMFGIYLLTAVVVAVITGIIEIPFTIARYAVEGGASSLGVLASTAAPSVLALIVGGIGGIIATTITRPVSSGVSVLLYADLRMRKEGFDLVLQQAGQNQGVSGDQFTSVWQPRTQPYGTQPAAAPGYPAGPGYPTAPGYGAAPGNPSGPGYPAAPGYGAAPGYPTAPGYGPAPGYPTAPGYGPGPADAAGPGYPAGPGSAPGSDLPPNPGGPTIPGPSSDGEPGTPGSPGWQPPA